MPILRIAFMMNRMRHNLNRRMQDTFGQQSIKNQQQTQEQSKKVYSDDEGEYVRFEEIKEPYNPSHPEQEETPRTRPEPRIVDVEFEEIK